MTVVVHSVLVKSDAAVIRKQTGTVHGSTMQIVIGMLPISGMLAVQERQVQSLLTIQPLKVILLARERSEVHMSCLEMLWASVGHRVKVIRGVELDWRRFERQRHVS